MIDEHAQPLLAGVDIGGTFTDVVLSVGGELRLHKLLSTPEQPARAMLAGLAAIGAMGATVTHGSTVATNAILERRGARTALITTEGFRDLLFIGRQNRPVLYALHPAIPPPLIPRAWCREVPERLDFQGKILVPLDIAALDAVLDDLAAQGIESVAVCLLYSYINPVHEHAIRDRMIARELFQPEQIALSSDVLPEFREFERASTTAIDAYVRPIVSRYLAEVEAGLAPPPPPPHLRWRGENPQKAISQEQRDQPEMSITPSPSADGEQGSHTTAGGAGGWGQPALFIMQSDGGVVRAATARRQAARMALSGPAAGVIGAMHLARLADFEQIITLDIGGTSTDVALCPGDPVRRTETSIDGLPLHLPVIDIETVGAGGGSLARLDAGGALRVGPASAGADPGPIIYGRGGQVVTVSDAHAVLGRLDPAHFLGGAMPLHLAPAQAALAALGEAMGSDGVTAARGVIAVANANIQRAIRRISVERGYDPRDFTLLAFGGAGPLHACEVAEGLGMTRVLVPSFPGVLCAFGLLVAEVARAASRTVLMPATPEHLAAALALVAEMAERGRADLAEEGIAPDAIATEAIFEMRYQGQAYELPVPATAEAVAAFHAAHARRYGFALPERAVELVTLRVRTAGQRCRPALKREATTPNDGGDALRATKEMLIDGAARAVPCYERVALRPGAAFAGPCLVLQRDTTTYVSPGWHATVDGYRNLLLALAP
jgi:N-methylhydantoinase A